MLSLLPAASAASAPALLPTYTSTHIRIQSFQTGVCHFSQYHSIFLVCYFLLLNLPPSFLLCLQNQCCLSCPNGSPPPLTHCLFTPCMLCPFPFCWLAFTIPRVYARCLCCWLAAGPCALPFSSWQSLLFVTQAFAFSVSSSEPRYPVYTSLLCFTVSSVPCCPLLDSPLPVTFLGEVY